MYENERIKGGKRLERLNVKLIECASFDVLLLEAYGYIKVR